jgi:4-amino-4-deoxy-L-arabinose transferase-like glycosyltransferase
MMTSEKVKVPGFAYAAILAVLGLLAYLPWLGSFGPLDPTDSFFLESAREMVETGKYLLPLNNYEPWLDKPILFFWMVCGFYKAFGVSPFIGRLPAALSAIATALCIFYGCRGLVFQPTAFLAGLVFLSLPLVSIGSHICLTDTTLTLLITATTLFLWKGLVREDKRCLFVGYLAAGLGLLCKGPIAPILSAIVILPALLVGTRSIKATVRLCLSAKPIQGLLLVALIAVPWYVAAGFATEGKFLQKFFIEQNFGRMVGTVNHQQPWYFYIPVFFGGFAPWCLLPLFSGGLVKDAVNRLGINGRSGLYRLSLLWFVAIVFMFTCIKTKLPWYIIPACPGFAIMSAIQIEQLATLAKSRALLVVQGAMLIALTVIVLIQGKLSSYLKGIVSDHWPVAAIVFLWLVIGFVVLQFARRQSPESRIWFASLSTASALLFGCAFFVPGALQAMYNHKQVGFNRLVELTRHDDASVAIFMAEEPTMPYILHKPVSRLQEEEECATFTLSRHAKHFVLVPREMLKRMNWFRGSSSKVISKEGKWTLFEMEPNQVAQSGQLQ